MLTGRVQRFHVSVVEMMFDLLAAVVYFRLDHTYLLHFYILKSCIFKMTSIEFSLCFCITSIRFTFLDVSLHVQNRKLISYLRSKVQLHSAFFFSCFFPLS